MLNLITYAAQTDQRGHDKLREIENSVCQQGIRLTVLSDLDQLVTRLDQPRSGAICLVMIVSRIEELAAISTHEMLLRDVRTVFVIPPDEEEMAVMGYRLKPSFLTFSESGVWEVIAVLRRMFLMHAVNEQVGILPVPSAAYPDDAVFNGWTGNCPGRLLH